jgi:hypothetical protein
LKRYKGLKFRRQNQYFGKILWHICKGRMFGWLKYEFGKLSGLNWKIAGVLVNWNCNLEKVEGINIKIGGLRIELQIEFEFQGHRCIIR